jgi:hypothetical protein
VRIARFEKSPPIKSPIQGFEISMPAMRTLKNSEATPAWHGGKASTASGPCVGGRPRTK